MMVFWVTFLFQFLRTLFELSSNKSTNRKIINFGKKGFYCFIGYSLIHYSRWRNENLILIQSELLYLKDQKLKWGIDFLLSRFGEYFGGISTVGKIESPFFALKQNSSILFFLTNSSFIFLKDFIIEADILFIHNRIFMCLIKWGHITRFSIQIVWIIFNQIEFRKNSSDYRLDCITFTCSSMKCLNNSHSKKGLRVLVRFICLEWFDLKLIDSVLLTISEILCDQLKVAFQLTVNATKYNVKRYQKQSNWDFLQCCTSALNCFVYSSWVIHWNRHNYNLGNHAEEEMFPKVLQTLGLVW